MSTAVRKKGFTLIEIMVATAAAAILILTVGTLLFAAIRSWRVNNTYVDMRRDAAYAIEMMSRDIRQAERGSAIVISANSLSIDNTIAGYTADFTRANDGTLSYSRDNTVLDPRMALNVKTFSANTHTNDDGYYNGITLQLEMENDPLDISFTNQTFVYIRNPRPE